MAAVGEYAAGFRRAKATDACRYCIAWCVARHERSVGPRSGVRATRSREIRLACANVMLATTGCEAIRPHSSLASEFLSASIVDGGGSWVGVAGRELHVSEGDGGISLKALGTLQPVGRFSPGKSWALLPSCESRLRQGNQRVGARSRDQSE